MRIAPLLLITCLAAPLPAQSSRNWSTTHVVLVSAATMGILVDWAQTRQALRQGWGERNPILGSHPSDGKLAVYNVLAIASTVSLGALLPSRWRTAWLGGVAIVEVFAIAGNARLGLHIGF